MILLSPSLLEDRDGDVTNEDARIFRRIAVDLQDALLGAEPKLSKASGWAFSEMYLLQYIRRQNKANPFGGDLAVREPVDYNRLQESSSFLRTSFDRLLALRGDELGSLRPVILLRALEETGLQMPAVSWAPILKRLIDSRKANVIEASAKFLISQLFSNPSPSILQSFLYLLSQVSIRQILSESIGSGAVTKLLVLSGLSTSPPENDGAVSVVAPTKAAEVLRKIFLDIMTAHEYSKEEVDIMEVIADHSAFGPLPLVESLAEWMLYVFDSYQEDPASDGCVRALFSVVDIICRSEKSAAQFISTRFVPLEDSVLSPRDIWGLARVFQRSHLAEHTQGLLGDAFGSPELGIIRLLQTALARTERIDQDEALVVAETAVCAFISAVHSRLSVSPLMPPGNSARYRDAVARASAPLNWVARLLDVVVIMCANRLPGGIEFGWSRAMAGLVGLLAGSVRPRGGDLIVVPQPHWDLLEAELPLTLSDLVRQSVTSEPDGSSYASQVGGT
ncbi:hypothetical protein HK405_005987 [Cladochytrium tenue]|nr:hypothetical protein HK405_005987 [Cladochytrium tenue]